VADTRPDPRPGEESTPSDPQRLPDVMTLTCSAHPSGALAEGGDTGGGVRRPSIVAARCVRPRPVRDWGTGRRRLIPCGRPRCSRECRDRWARRMSEALRRSFAVLPPTHFLRVTALGPMRPKELTQCVRRFLRRLRWRGCEYLAVNEWREGRRHHHVLVRTDGELTPAIVAELWRASCPGARVTSYCKPVSSVDGAARYVVKDLQDGSKKEVPPEEFGGRLFSSSKHFLAEPLKILMRAVVEEWRVTARTRPGKRQRGNSSGVRNDHRESEG
jgi:hypothetical protein